MIHHSASPRFEAFRDIDQRSPKPFKGGNGAGHVKKVSEYFGENTFGLSKMREKLTSDVAKKLFETLELGRRIDIEIADPVAQAMKEWAIEKGATHFTRWFQPQTGSTAEKHDSFLSFSENQTLVEHFSGEQLIRSEPDASSFPSGGMRSTFEARGYTVWDPSSPVFIMEAGGTKTLCIPSAFISFNGDALDMKTVLMRSVEALSTASRELLQLIGETQAARIVPTLGTEQEYFLVDRALFYLRPDLVMSGRTLCGAVPPRGQQLDDHYFGAIPERVQAFMAEAEYELHRLGVPVKTRHNEVAPAQYETAPIFEDANVAIDHNQLCMEVFKKVAKRHHFALLLHEKPFKDLNGNGKHANWALRVDYKTGSSKNLLDPGKTPKENLRFLLFLVATLKGVHRHAGLLRAGIGTAGNDHRLGANEAPPSIISVFLGSTLSRILDEIEKGTSGTQSSEEVMLKLGVAQPPRIGQDNTDRNRTSPFAFTGNKFEFRAVGANSSPAIPTTFLNSAVAEATKELTDAIKKKLKETSGGIRSVDVAAMEVLKEAITETKAIRFEGNNYSEEWVQDAESRQLPNLRHTPDALDQLRTEATKNVLCGLGVFSERELESRYNVRIEQYSKKVEIELESFQSIVESQVLPACYQYHQELASGIGSAKSLGMAAPQEKTFAQLNSIMQSMQAALERFKAFQSKLPDYSSEETKAKAIANEGIPLMEELRTFVDQLEGIVPDTRWPLPKYRELLFIS